MAIGERIVQLRKEQNLSQGDLAAALDISRQAVSKWENDTASPDTLNLIRLADILDTDVEYLATGRRSLGRRPPKVITSVQTIEKIVKEPVIQEKIVEKIVEKPVIQYIPKPIYVEKPVIRRLERVKYRQNPLQLLLLGLVCFAVGILVGYFLL